VKYTRVSSAARVAWARFIDQVRIAEDELKPQGEVWYRGVTESGHKLTPSLLRYSNGLNLEPELFAVFQMVARADIGLSAGNNWARLFSMQHHAVPTRLLDWTTALAVAVYFAIRPSGSGDPAVYVLNPETVNLSALSSVKVDLLGRNGPKDYDPTGGPSLPLPFACLAPYDTERIRAQSGRFTVHGKKIDPVEKAHPSSTRQIRISQTAIPAAREFLRYAGINDYTIYPDVEGLAPYLKSMTGLR